jgi:hypothetical protein
MYYQLALLDYAVAALEVSMGYEMAIVWSGFATRVSHAEQRHFMTLRPHQLHGLEQVDFGTAEGEVIFVAI